MNRELLSRVRWGNVALALITVPAVALVVLGGGSQPALPADELAPLAAAPAPPATAVPRPAERHASARPRVPAQRRRRAKRPRRPRPRPKAPRRQDGQRVGPTRRAPRWASPPPPEFGFER